MNETRSKTGHIELTFSPNIKEMFSEITDRLVPEGFYYKSPVMDHIKGNVASALHCTIFYGLKEEDFTNPDLLDLVNNAKFDTIKLGEIVVFRGHQGLYKLIRVEIVDEDDLLLKFSNQIAKITGKFYEFRPHLTLAYVQPDYRIPRNFPPYEREIPVEGVRIVE